MLSVEITGTVIQSSPKQQQQQQTGSASCPGSPTPDTHARAHARTLSHSLSLLRSTSCKTKKCKPFFFWVCRDRPEEVAVPHYSKQRPGVERNPANERQRVSTSLSFFTSSPQIQASGSRRTGAQWYADAAVPLYRLHASSSSSQIVHSVRVERARRFRRELARQEIRVTLAQYLFC